jgi:hypothetical protein
MHYDMPLIGTPRPDKTLATLYFGPTLYSLARLELSAISM